MDSIQAFFLGIVQGITEFLPISSSAHLILTSKFFGWADQGLNFDICVHFGSLIAVIIYFRTEFIKMFIGMFQTAFSKQTENAELFKKLFVATVPIVIFALLFKDLIATTFRDNIAIIGVTSIFWGILLYFGDKQEQSITQSKKICYKTAFLMGLAQAIAIIPGTSRSGSTMTIARFLKFSRQSAAEFSMLMSIPVISLMMIANIFEMCQSNIICNLNLNFLVIGTISSFTFALLSIHLLMTFVNKVGFLPFIIYRILLGFIIFAIIL